MLTRTSAGWPRLCGVILLAACAASSAEDSNVGGVQYPVCDSPAQQCLDSIPVGSGLQMPFFRNFSLTTPNPAITEAIIAVHASGRHANDSFYTVATAADQAGSSETALVVAPHFQCDEDHPPRGEIFWSCSGDDWSHGFADVSGANPPLSSYAVMDVFVNLIADKATFPNLTEITITGMGSGGQLTQRYAATNQVDPTAGVKLQYAVVGPSSYAYLDATRPTAPESCASTGDCAFSTPDASSCSDYDDYYYGLENRSGYVGIPSATQVQSQFVQRQVLYVVGDEDTLANAAGTGLDTSCEANLQGPDRLSRAIAFWNELHSVYQAQHQLVIVPGCMASLSCMYFSPELRAVLFPP